MLVLNLPAQGLVQTEVGPVPVRPLRLLMAFQIISASGKATDPFLDFGDILVSLTLQTLNYKGLEWAQAALIAVSVHYCPD